MTHNSDPSKPAGDRDDLRLIGSIDPATLLPRRRDPILGETTTTMTLEQIERMRERFGAAPVIGEISCTDLGFDKVLGTEPFDFTDNLPIREFKLNENNIFNTSYEIKESELFNPINLKREFEEVFFTLSDRMRSFLNRTEGERYSDHDDGSRVLEEPSGPLFDHLPIEYPVIVATPKHDVRFLGALPGVVEIAPTFVFIDKGELSEGGPEASEVLQYPESSTPARADEE